MPILIILILVIDYLAWQPIQVLIADWSSVYQNFILGFYASTSLVALGYCIGMMTGLVDRATIQKNNASISLLFFAYLSKFFLLLVLMLGNMGGGLVYLIDNIFSSNFYLQIPEYLSEFVAVFFGLLLFVLLTYGMFRNTYRFKVYRSKIVLDNLPSALNGLKIVQISDIHAGSFRQKEPIKKAIERINQEQADLVFFTGDLVNTFAQEILPFVDVFDKIESRYGVYSILGNHDYGDYAMWKDPEQKRKNLQLLANTQHKMGWDLLLNEHRILEINDEEIAIIGVENFAGNPRFTRYGNLQKAYQGSSAAALKLLLSHDPSHWNYEVTKDFKDIDVTFSGHTHGGQFGIELGNFIKWSPVKYAYKEWAGLYQKGKQFLYVNRGFGVLGYRGRIGILPEISVIELFNSSST